MSIAHILSRQRATLTLLLALSTLAACDNPKRLRLVAELNDLQSQADRLRQVTSDEQSALAAMNQRLVQQKADLANFTAGVRNYMLEHKLAVAALVAGLGGAATALDNTNVYSEDAKQLGSAVAVVAGIWALGNLDEVSQVLEALNRADAQVRGLQAAIAQTSADLKAQQSSIDQAQTQLLNVAAQRAALEQQLNAL